MATNNTQSPVHEIDANGRHRIVTFRQGVPVRSQWFESYEIANFRGLFASTREQGGIPSGIFRIVPVAYESL